MDLSLLDLEIPAPSGYGWPPSLETSPDGFVATTAGEYGTIVRIRQDGRVW